jgi:hypothetical protein
MKDRQGPLGFNLPRLCPLVDHQFGFQWQLEAPKKKRSPFNADFLKNPPFPEDNRLSP